MCTKTQILRNVPELLIMNLNPVLLLALYRLIFWSRFVQSYEVNYTALQKSYSIRMYWTNFWKPTVHVQQNIFEKTLLEVGSSHLYASFGTFCVQIDQLFETQWDFKLSEEFEIDVIFLRKQRFYSFLTFFKISLCLD